MPAALLPDTKISRVGFILFFEQPIILSLELQNLEKVDHETFKKQLRKASEKREKNLVAALEKIAKIK